MGLRKGDLQNLIQPVFEIDNYKSKMGDDEDIVVLSFSLTEQNAATDLVEFIEKSYTFVLDADSTVSELDSGTYKVFVEMERNRDINENIMSLLYGVSKLSQMDEFKFRYYKNFRSYDANLDNLKEKIPTDARSYTLTVMENADSFFANTISKIDFIGESIILKKSYADPIAFRIKDFGDTSAILEKIEQKINMNDYAEILFLTKYIGDYNIMKFGHNTLTFENNGHTLVVERI